LPLFIRESGWWRGLTPGVAWLVAALWQKLLAAFPRLQWLFRRSLFVFQVRGSTAPDTPLCLRVTDFGAGGVEFWLLSVRRRARRGTS
jgi:hypothetical protein